MRHKGSKTIWDFGFRNLVSVSGKIGNVNPSGIVLRRPTPSIFTERKKFIFAIEYDTYNGVTGLAKSAQSGLT